MWSSWHAGAVVSLPRAIALGDQVLAELPRRRAHSHGVLERARGLAHLFPDREAEILCSAAMLHDIGYAEQLAVTGFHPLDGARYLRSLEVDQRIVNLVAHHSCALLGAEELGLADQLRDDFELDEPDLVDALAVCDMTTTPDGELTTVESRIEEIRDRYGADSVVGRFVVRARPQLLAAAGRVGLRAQGASLSPRREPWR
jgi:putative nucleotidyltransferase with HDIG domain